MRLIECKRRRRVQYKDGEKQKGVQRLILSTKDHIKNSVLKPNE